MEFYFGHLCLMFQVDPLLCPLVSFEVGHDAVGFMAFGRSDDADK